MGFWRWVSKAWQFRCVDDRGVERAIPFPSWMRLSRDGVPRAYRLHLRSMSWRFFAMMFALSLLPVATGIVGHGVWEAVVMQPWFEAARANPGRVSAPPSTKPLIYMQYGSMAVMAGGLIALWPLCSRGVARRYVRGMVERCRCPWCSYDLSGCPPAEVTTCPECGGGWRVGG